MSKRHHRILGRLRKFLFTFLLVSNGCLITSGSAQSDPCTVPQTSPSCQATIILEVGGCRTEFGANICPCQDVVPTGQCGNEPCPNEPDGNASSPGPETAAPPTRITTAPETTGTSPTTTTTTTTTTRPPDQTDWGKNVTSCQDLYQQGARTSQVYRLYPAQDGDGFDAFCDMDEQTGTGWTVIQRRDPQDTNVDFYKLYPDYIDGFGDVAKSHWLGLDKVYSILNDNYVRLIVEMTDWEGHSAFAEYSRFKIEHPALFYRIRVTYSHGTAGDGLVNHKMMYFSALDKDDDRNSHFNCAREYEGSFWYNYCTLGWTKANPNGPYRSCPGSDCHIQPGIYWTTWRDEPYSLRSIVMKMA